MAKKDEMETLNGSPVNFNNMDVDKIKEIILAGGQEIKRRYDESMTLTQRLGDLGKQVASELGATEEVEEVAPVKRGRKPGVKVIHKAARVSNEITIPGGVLMLLVGAGDKGLSRSDIAEKMVSDLGYKTRADTDGFENSVYASGIYPSMKKGYIKHTREGVYVLTSRGVKKAKKEQEVKVAA